MHSRTAGFSLIELLVALLLISVVLAGAISAFTGQNAGYKRQDLIVSMEQNLRVGMSMVTDTLRTSGYGVPKANVSTWVDWVPGFTANPTITTGSPASISVAGCFQVPVATLTTRAAAGATTLSVTSNVSGKSISDLLDTGSKSLIFVDGTENGVITLVSDTSISIDTDPTHTNDQGLAKSYPAGTPVCRVDVYTFAISTDPSTGLLGLVVDMNQGSGTQFAAQGINNLAITTVSAGKQYQVSLTAQSETVDPVIGVYFTHSLSSNVTLKN